MARLTRSASFRFAAAAVLPWVRAFTRRDWRGQANLPRDQGFLVVVNHTSYADPFLSAHYLVQAGLAPRFLGKESVFRIPGVGRLLAHAGQIPVHRESADAVQSFSAAVRAVQAGECVVIYPEGTFTRDPDLWPMRAKTGAARLALQTGCPVVPLAVWGAHAIMPGRSRFPRLLPRQQVSVWAGTPVDLSAFVGRPLDADVLTGASTVIMDALAALVGAIRAVQPPQERWDPEQHGQSVTGDPRQRRTR